MNNRLVSGWTINIDEVSNGVFEVMLTNSNGYKAEFVDNATDEIFERAISYAFDIEKQVSKNWTLFLYDLAIHKLSEEGLNDKKYNDETFGCWFIERQNKRLVYDGKNSWLVFQTKIEDDWTDVEIKQKDKLKYLDFVRQMVRLVEIP